MNNRAYRLYRLLKEITYCCREREAVMAKRLGLKEAETRALMAIKMDHCKTSADLADTLNVARSRITRILDGLVKAGLVKRSEDKSDRRIAIIDLTNKGEEATERLTGFTLQLHEAVLNTLPEGMRGKTLAVLGSVREAMDSVKSRMGERNNIDIFEKSAHLDKPETESS